MREYENDLERFQTQISNIMLDPNDLIKNELIEETLSLVKSATESNLVSTLSFISDNIGSKKRNDMMPQIKDLTIYIFEYIKKAGLEPSDVAGIIHRLISVYRSHKSSHKAVVEIKEQLDYVVPKAIKARHAATRSATKVAILVYITLRVLSISYYNG